MLGILPPTRLPSGLKLVNHLDIAAGELHPDSNHIGVTWIKPLKKFDNVNVKKWKKWIILELSEKNIFWLPLDFNLEHVKISFFLNKSSSTLDSKA